MIVRNEIVREAGPLPPEIERNVERLLSALNKVRSAFKRPMIVTSGLRSMEHHESIYRRMGKKPPLFSAHLVGLAADIADRDGRLWAWCMENLHLLEAWGLYLEDRSKTPSWVHMQLRPPASGHRIFLP